MFDDYTFDTATPETLAEYSSFIGSQNLESRLTEGDLRYEQLCQMHSARGLEAAWVNAAAPVLFPRGRDDLDEAGLEALARHLAQTASGKRIILNADRMPLPDAPWLAAGWRLDVHAVMADTDLTAGSWPLDPRVQERPVSELLAPDLLELYASLVMVGTIGDTDETDPAVAFEDDLTDEGKRLFVLLEGETVLGAAVLTPDSRGAGIHVLGVRPDRRGAGLGRALHAHLLAVAAQTHGRHGGTTNFSNLPMRRILEANGARLTEQKQWLLGE